jgi:crossover junction endodeoxyribonuclease RuvC
MGYGVIKVVGTKAMMLAMGVIDLRKYSDSYLKLGRIFERVRGIIDSYLPDELAIEAPFFGKNVQTMLKLGRAQGVAMAAAISRQVPISEYMPKKAKMAVTGNGNASKEQVAGMLAHLLGYKEMPEHLDSTDALSLAVCHFFNTTVEGAPRRNVHGGWEAFVKQNSSRVSGGTAPVKKSDDGIARALAALKKR